MAYTRNMVYASRPSLLSYEQATQLIDHINRSTEHRTVILVFGIDTLRPARTQKIIWRNARLSIFPFQLLPNTNCFVMTFRLILHDANDTPHFIAMLRNSRLFFFFFFSPLTSEYLLSALYNYLKLYIARKIISYDVSILMQFTISCNFALKLTFSLCWLNVIRNLH